MVSTVNYAASANRALKEGEASALRVAIRAANITPRGNHLPFPASVAICTRIHVQGKKPK